MKFAAPVIAFLSVALIGSVTANVLQYKRYSSSRPLMTFAAGQAITKKQYQDRLDYEFGKQVLNRLAYRALINDAAKKANALPTEKDIDGRIADIERRNPSLLEAAKLDKTKMADLRETIAADLAFENLRIKDVKLSDAEVAAFFAANKNAFALPAQAQTTLVVAQNDVDAGTAKELLEQGIKPEVIARQPRLRVVGVGGFQLPPQMPQEVAARINEAVFGLKQGQVASVPVGKAFLVVRLNNSATGGVPPLAEVRPLVERVAKMSKAPSPDETLARLYKEADVTFEVDRYAPFFADMEERAKKLNAPTKAASADKAAATPAPRS